MPYFKLYAKCSAREFVGFWQQFYRSKIPDEVYQANLNLGSELSEENVSLLWKWKNERYGSPLIEPTQAILEHLNAFRRLEHIDQTQEQNFWQKAFTVSRGIVWQVFLFHIACPYDYPVFDQHVMRAFFALTKGYIYRSPKEARVPCVKYEIFCSSYSGYKAFFFEMLTESPGSLPSPRQ